MMTYYHWHPIQDLPENWSQFENPDLKPLALFWQIRRLDLQTSDKLKKFNERLSRRWAIETGIIERIYTLDRGITQLLIEEGIDASLIPHGTTDKPPELIVSIIQDQKEVVDGLFDFVAQRRDLSTSYIKQMHQLFTRNQKTTNAIDQFGNYIKVEIIKGDWKKWPNNPSRLNGEIHEYCPPEQVSSEVDRLITMHLEHNQLTVSPEIEAAWLHHRFTQIHPFQDGNGRIARALASLVFLRAGWFPLVISNDLRSEYISALESADSEDLSPLIQLFSRIEITAFRTALSVSDDLPTEKPVIDLLINQSLERIQDKRKQKQNQIFDLSKILENITYRELETLAGKINQKIKQIDNDFWASVTKSETGKSDYWFRSQIIEIANKIDYYANFSNYRAWVQLKIHEERVAYLTFSFHGLGVSSKYLGIMAVSAFLEFRTKSTEEEGNNYEGPYQICRDIFQFSSQDTERELCDRFSVWLGETITIGLREWQTRL